MHARRTLDPKTVDTLGVLSPEAVARVRAEAWPDPENAEEVHESLLWMGFVTEDEAERSGWQAWLEELRVAGRVMREHGTVVYLRARLESLWERTRQHASRPLLRTPDPRGTLAELLEKRDPQWTGT